MSEIKLKKLNENKNLLVSLMAQDTNDDWFDFATSKIKIDRSGSDYYQLGDVELAVRKLDGSCWDYFNTKDDQDLVASPVEVSRKWKTTDDGAEFQVSLTNILDQPVEVGGLGFAMIFNQIFTDNTLDESHNNSSFIDPYIGLDAGYLQVARLNGAKPTLLVTNKENAQFEAYKPLNDDKTKKDVHFEGFYEWTVYSKAYFEDQWDHKQQWNNATSLTLNAGESKNFTLAFTAVENQRNIPAKLVELGIPSVDSTPGYVIHGKEEITLKVTSESQITQVSVTPGDAIEIKNTNEPNEFKLTRIADFFGSTAVTVEYANGLKQTINYYVTESAKELVSRLANFHNQKQWVEGSDKFGRRHSFITYDKEADRQVVDEYRSFISGDSDETGAGPNLLMAMKNLYMPDKEQIHKLEQYVDDVLWGTLQAPDYSIRASLYYENNDFVYSWDKSRSEETWRAYNYPHQAAIYWVMYRLARNYDDLVNNHDWQWYLNQSYQTVMAMHRFCGKDAFLYLEQYGLMVGSVHRWILDDLQAEGWKDQADKFVKYMCERYNIWSSLQYPYGSEMPWDSTGQEEVYMWCDYFQDDDKAKQTVNAILAYTPAIPHWGYNGDSRRYFDSFVYGKRVKITREFGHYGSSLNAIPILNDYKYHDSDNLYNLKAGYAASSSILSSIDQEGFGSMAFLTDPEYMEFEPYTSDFGQAFYGYVHDAGQYAFKANAEGEWTSLGGNINVSDDVTTFTPTDAFGHKLFVHNGNTDFEINSEVLPMSSIEFDSETNVIKIKFDRSGILPKNIRINVTDNLVPVSDNKLIRGSYEFDQGSLIAEFKLNKKNAE
ncbi:DUF5695 domain-containing protein [Lentilactobacillus sp. Marseille-Q4993]|uniref:DUF5695 domain-containing protein n=1 Tax=Lentilactobacillus sp. Marseille-Q4993 TaxID=3039492 RepID=UPI0024BCDFF7|nr:DUF5695 domain-containing protein [Lentilactobacillus sp. Marseille-Q4993]